MNLGPFRISAAEAAWFLVALAAGNFVLAKIDQYALGGKLSQIGAR